MSEILERLKKLPANVSTSPALGVSLLAFVLGGLGLLAGLVLWFHPGLSSGIKNPVSAQTIELPEDTNPSELASASSNLIVVDVAGAVKKPGVYSLPTNSRVSNALEVAGGLTRKADLGFIHKELNLADKISEGQKVYFPPIQTETDSSITPDTQNAGSDNPISINSASAEELSTLPGIGEKLAAKIIGGRPYQNVEELTTKVKIGASVFNKIKDAIKL